MNCPKCGKEILQGHRFCSHCDYELTREDMLAVSKEKKAKRKGKAVFAIIAAVVVALAGGSWFTLRGPGGGSVIPQPTREPVSVVTAAPVTVTQAPVIVTQTTAAPTQAPVTPTPQPDNVVYFTGSTEAELGEVFYNMIETGADTLIIDTTRFSEASFDVLYEDDLNSIDLMWGPTAVDSTHAKYRFEWYPGVRIWHAVMKGEEASLDVRDQTILQRARSVVGSLITPGMSDWDKELALHDYIVHNCDYLIDVENLNTQNVYGFFEHGKVQCAGYADTFFLLGRLAGLKVHCQYGDIIEDNEAHAWNLVLLDGAWYTLDVCWDDPTGERSIRWYYFNLPADNLAKVRRWNRNIEPAGYFAPSLDHNFYYHDMPRAANTNEAVQLALEQLRYSRRAEVLITNPAAFNADQADNAVGFPYHARRWHNFHDFGGVGIFTVWFE